ncbi:tRNA pseudouridine38-40 synthase [Hydrobacter penzbergensis]|uniref:tRNA pseudouridine synthase A n=1 Tax=Hydrobacter penzbergensis TaxID=1235997 RepID=A0A8X8IDD4_9BACT|nr:tRNA pseudouridine(38-40) synthase TruA [Hydrobacter penzbergensis]SDW32792.1 tRNA pseudouridine38-40 synthase [Hydrobacter penzbergensis]
MARYFLEVAYMGTHYSGFQVQDHHRTIQSELTRSLEVLFRAPFALTGSSRTDAGVHALQNFFHVDTELELTDKHVYNLNAILLPDVAVKSIRRMPDEAHCRFDAIARAYRYHIYRHKDPFLKDRGWLYPYPLNKALLDEAAGVLMDYRDFTSFSKRNTQVKTFQCTIERSAWETVDNGLVYRVKANRFLRGMVRGLVGTMLKVGREQISIDDFKQIIEARNCTLADFTTPPQGLFLEAVIYPDGYFS